MENIILNNFKYLQIAICGIIFCSLLGCSHALDGFPIAGQVFVLSVSSDGSYVISSNGGKRIILWDIQHKIEKVISTNGNIYSAYFIKNTHDFLWQDLNDLVHVETVDGKELLSFNNFPTYGEVMSSDLKYYFSSDQDWNLYSGYGKSKELIKSAYQMNGFLGVQKLLNLTLSNNNKYLLTSGDSDLDIDNLPLSVGYSTKEAYLKGYKFGILNGSLLEGIVLWNTLTGKPLYKLSGDSVKAFATISPDNSFVVGGDEDGLAFVWNTQNGKRLFSLENPTWGKIIKVANTGNDIKDYKSDTTGLIPMPHDFYTNFPNISYLSLKFIDLQDHFLNFYTYLSNYVILFSVKSALPIKYIHLAKFPKPTMDAYSMDESIDTAPAANILVMGQADGPGIIVYKYHPDAQTLEKIWAPGADNVYLSKVFLLNFFLASAIASFILMRYSQHWLCLINFIAAELIYVPFGFFYTYQWGFATGCVGNIIGILIVMGIYFYSKFTGCSSNITIKKYFLPLVHRYSKLGSIYKRQRLFNRTPE